MGWAREEVGAWGMAAATIDVSCWRLEASKPMGWPVEQAVSAYAGRAA